MRDDSFTATTKINNSTVTQLRRLGRANGSTSPGGSGLTATVGSTLCLVGNARLQLDVMTAADGRARARETVSREVWDADDFLHVDDTSRGEWLKGVNGETMGAHPISQ